MSVTGGWKMVIGDECDGVERLWDGGLRVLKGIRHERDKVWLTRNPSGDVM